MQRVLKAAGEQRERRPIRPAQTHAVPRLTATGPNQVWSWDITKLALKTRGKWLYLYVVIDLYSRYIVGWMIAETENAVSAQRFIGTAVARHQIAAHSLTVHQDRGAPMTAVNFMSLRTELKIDISHSRPRVCNDNPFSEAHFKKLKTQPCYPKYFNDLNHAPFEVCATSVQYLLALGCLAATPFPRRYNDEHHHSGLNGHIPADVFHGRADAVNRIKQRALDAAYTAHPERFVNGPPIAKAPPRKVSINPLPISVVTVSAPMQNNEIGP